MHIVFDETNPTLKEMDNYKDKTRHASRTEVVQWNAPGTSTNESTVVEDKWTTPIDKTSIPLEWRHNSNYPENFILGKPDDNNANKTFLMKISILGSYHSNGDKMN